MSTCKLFESESDSRTSIEDLRKKYELCIVRKPFLSAMLCKDLPASKFSENEYSEYFEDPKYVTGDGNCLYNCMSLLLCGSEKLNIILRILTCTELFVNGNYYANHPSIRNTTKSLHFQDGDFFILTCQ